LKIHDPIIFTTADEEYALKAFEVNSIDYSLKPINIRDLYIIRALLVKKSFSVWKICRKSLYLPPIKDGK
jgi:two-component SAPR family response regulator